jgi:hypothetical protein
MDHCRILCTVVLAVSMLGCHAPEKSPQLPEEPEDSVESSNVFYADVAELSKIITTMCETFEITIEEATEAPGRCEWVCKSLTGLDIKLEAIALVKGSTLVLITVGGEKQVVRHLHSQIRSDLNNAVNSYRRRHPHNRTDLFRR